MFRLSWKVAIGLVFISATVILAGFHVLLFHDPKDLFFYLALDIVFVPIQVLLVTIIIEELLEVREKQAMIKKLNMVIGAFFSEVGTLSLRQINGFCEDAVTLRERFAVNAEWGIKEYKDAMKYAAESEHNLSPTPGQFIALTDFLLKKRLFILGLLQNPNLLEHEDFSNLLWAITHLTEELELRADFKTLPPKDIEHLHGDIRRAFGLLMREWLAYMQHLRTEYPYLYSLAMRNNPFNPEPSPVIQ